MCRYRNEDGAAAPVLRNQFVLDKLLFYLLDIGTRLIDLVDRYDDLNTCCLRMVDRLDGLRHNTVICCNNEDCNISGFCTTHTHCGKCLMSRRIEECDLLSVDLYHVRTDVLSDTACLFCSYIGLADCIQKGGFTMIDMTHNAYNRRTGYHVLLILFFLFQKFLDDVNLDLFLTEYVKLHRDLFCLLVIYFLIDGDNLAL